MIGLTGAAAFGQSPRASGQYGYGGAAATPQGGASYTCQPTDSCHEMYGCHVWVCPCPCQGKDLCREIQSQLPPVKPEPTCQEVPICYIDTDMPPGKHRTIDIYRNCYVPVRIQLHPIHHPNVTSVDFRVKWREVHVLCDEYGNPMPPEKASAILKDLEQSYASLDSHAVKKDLTICSVFAVFPGNPRGLAIVFWVYPCTIFHGHRGPIQVD